MLCGVEIMSATGVVEVTLKGLPDASDFAFFFLADLDSVRTGGLETAADMTLEKL